MAELLEHFILMYLFFFKYINRFCTQFSTQCLCVRLSCKASEREDEKFQELQENSQMRYKEGWLGWLGWLQCDCYYCAIQNDK